MSDDWNDNEKQKNENQDDDQGGLEEPEEEDSDILEEEITEEKPKTWLEQFDVFKHEIFSEFKEVAKLGLQPLEVEALVWMSTELMHTALQYDSEALDKLYKSLSSRDIQTRK